MPISVIAELPAKSTFCKLAQFANKYDSIFLMPSGNVIDVIDVPRNALALMLVN